MLTFFLSVVALFSIAETLKIDVKRDYLYVNPKENENTIFNSIGLGQNGVVNGSNDQTLSWKKPVDIYTQGDLTLSFRVGYNNEPEVKSFFRACGPLSNNDLKDFGRAFLYRAVAENKNKCPLNKSSTKCAGHVQLETNKVPNGIHCGKSVKVTIKMYNRIITMTNTVAKRDYFHIFEVTYTGTFSGC